MGRATTFTQELADEICSRISEGESLRKICEDPQMPGRRTVFDWLAKNDDFRDDYALAHQRQAEYFVGQIVEMADAATPQNWQVVKLQIWARQWTASKLHPKKYSDRHIQEHAVGDNGPIVFTWGAAEEGRSVGVSRSERE